MDALADDGFGGRQARGDLVVGTLVDDAGQQRGALVVREAGEELCEMLLVALRRQLLDALQILVVQRDRRVVQAPPRVGLDAPRPLLAVNPRQRWRELMEARRPLYTEVARAVVGTDDRSPEDVAEAVLDALQLKDV